MKILLRILVGLIVTVALVAVSLNFYLRSKLPEYEGERRLQGLNKLVEVYFDEYAVPHIYAETEEDAYYALGFTHAQERLFQMDLMRRAGKGELSTLLGGATIETDKFFRTLGIHITAKRLVGKYFQNEQDPFVKAFRAYLKGVNAYIATGKGSVEHLILQADIPPFEPEDVYAIGGILGIGFAEGFRNEPVLTYISQLGKTYLEELSTTPASNSTHIATFQPADSALVQATGQSVLQALHQLPIPLWMGSNSWAIAPSRTSSGKAILANDTHMGYSQPAVWFEAHLEYPNHSFVGLHAAGIPFGLIGRNREVAWGLTMFENDDTDFFQEKINPENPKQVWFNNEWVEVKEREEVIEVKDGKSVIVTVRETPNGPILSDLTDSHWKKLSDKPISLWWAFHHTDIRSFQGWYGLAKAKNIGDARECVKMLDAPGLNVMCADADGNIAWWAAAKLFKRPKHVNSYTVLNGAGEDGPLPFVDFSYNPKAENPPWGYVYSANNKPDSLQGLDVPGYYFADHRAKAIEDMLKVRNDWDVEKVQEMQWSTKVSQKQDLAHDMLGLLSEKSYQEGLAKEAYDLLKGWDGNHELSETAPVIYYKFQYHLVKEMMADELNEEAFVTFLSSNLFLHSIPKLLNNRGAIWWDNVGTEEVETAQQIADKAYTQTIEELSQKWGTDVKAWEWGKMHFVKHPHALGKGGEWLDKIFSIEPAAIVGGREVINNVGLKLTDEEVYMATYGPAMRFIVDFADVDHAWNVLPTGQSGHVLSLHYRDQANMYNTGQQRLQCINKKEIVEGAKSMLLLKP